MDGMPQNLMPDTAAPIGRSRQTTLKSAIGCVGVGLHSGRRVRLTFQPAPAGHGIVFRRTDLRRDIPARFDTVIDTRLCTVIADPAMASARVGTIEHVMAALTAMGVDNVLVELDGPEVPILDGSAAPFVFLLDCAGLVEQVAPPMVIAVHRKVRVAEGDAWAELQPLPRHAPPGLELAVTIDFAASAIGRQHAAMRLAAETFRADFARARTFALAEDIDALRANGLAQGGSLDNAVVVDGDRVLNPGGLHMPDEFARHKLLDAIGDLGLAGGALCGRFVAHRPGHALNNKLLRALFADPAAWTRTASEALAA